MGNRRQSPRFPTLPTGKVQNAAVTAQVDRWPSRGQWASEHAGSGRGERRGQKIVNLFRHSNATTQFRGVSGASATPPPATLGDARCTVSVSVCV